MNKWLALLLIGLALILSASGLAWTQHTAQNRLAAQPLAPPARPRSPLGVNVALQAYLPAQRTATLDAVKQAGFGWVRQRFPWDEIEPTRGEFRWQPWDEIVAAAAERNLDLLVVLDGAPAWARSAADAANPLAPPANHADFGRFAAAVAARYGTTLRFYQLWDEPNIAPHWGSGAVNAVGYTALLREGAVQLRNADRDAVILLAALAPTTEPGGTNQSDPSFLADLYTAGAAPWFDAVAAQPYGFIDPPDAPPAADRFNFRRVELLRAVMLAHDDAATPVWLTAFGWANFDIEAHPTWISDALAWSNTHWGWVTGAAWSLWQATPEIDAPSARLALVDEQGQPQAALTPLRTWMQAAPPLNAGDWPLDAAGIRAQGGWRLTVAAADPPHDATSDNNTLRIPFTGDSLALALQRGPYWGYLTVTIDGAPANALPRDAAGNANILLYDPLARPAWVMVARALPAGAHVAEIHATGGWDQWPLRALRVGADSPPARPTWWIWALGLPGLLLTLLGVAGLHRQLNARPVVTRTPLPLWDAAARVPPVLRYGVLAALTAGAVMLSGPAQLAVLLALLLCLLLDPGLGLALPAAAAPLFLTRVTLLGRAVSPAEAAVWLLTVALAARGLLDWLYQYYVNSKRPPLFTWRPHALDWPVLALLLAALLSLPAVQERGVALHELRTVILAGALAYALVRAAPANAAGYFDPWPLFWGSVLGAVVVAGWGLVQLLAGVDLIGAEGVWRVRGPYGSPNNLALYLDHAWPLALAVALFGVTRARRLAAGAAAVVILLGIGLTFSRGALLLGVPAAVLCLGLLAGGRWRWAALGVLAVGALALLPLWQTERFAGLFDLQGGTSFFRVQLWRGAWTMGQEQPWQGVGLDNFLYAYRTRYALPTAWQELNLSHPHNLLLDLWTRLGVPGLAAGLWLLSAATMRAWAGSRRISGDRRALLLGVLASLAATVAHGFIDNSLFLVDLMLLCMFSLGLIARLDDDPS